jgi:His/Glu/Gln/Arg/opine family amino acid ABC transporter permease subunit
MDLNEQELSQAENDRRDHRKAQRKRSVWISLASTLAFAVIVWFGLIATPGWERVEQSFFNWDVAVASFPRVIDGLLLNLRVLVAAAILVLFFGLLLAIIRTLKSPVFFPLRVLSKGYVDLFRGLPLIIVLYLVGFGIPGLRLEFLGRIPAEVLGIVALTITYSAYVSEVFRAGIESVHSSQRLAARSLGLSYSKSMRLVVLPQAVRKVVPPLMNDFIALQKDVGLISVLGAIDAVRGAQIEVAKFANFTPYVVAGLLFVLLAIPTIRLGRQDFGEIHCPRTAGSHTVIDWNRPRLKVVGLKKFYGDRRVINGVDLEVFPGQIVALIGSSGSGKSTLLRCVNQIEDLTDGQIFLDGEEVSAPGVNQDLIRAQIGLVFQSFNLFTHLSILNNITLALRHVKKMDKDAANKLAQSWLARIGLGDRGDSYPDKISGGQQQRAAIIRAVAMEPKVLLLDEVTSALDPELVGEVLDLIRELKSGGTTILMATHELSFAREVADWVIFLEQGQIYEQGEAKDFFEKASKPRTIEFLSRMRSR